MNQISSSSTRRLYSDFSCVPVIGLWCVVWIVSPCIPCTRINQNQSNLFLGAHNSHNNFCLKLHCRVLYFIRLVVMNWAGLELTACFWSKIEVVILVKWNRNLLVHFSCRVYSCKWFFSERTQKIRNCIGWSRMKALKINLIFIKEIYYYLQFNKY